MKILTLGYPFFDAAWRRLGVEVRHAGTHPDADLCLARRELVLPEILERLLPFQPDIIFYTESLKARELPLGLGEAPIPRVFYSLDPHLQFNWQKDWARLFDRVYVSQRNFVPRFLQEGCEDVRWLPYSVEPWDGPKGNKRDLDISMVGSFATGPRIKRLQLLREIRQRFRLHLFGPPYQPFLSQSEMLVVYGRSRIVFNESVHQDVNFRVFEALNAGALLVTEDPGNGLERLFTPGRDLVTYQGEELFELLEYYLSHAEESRRLAANGKRELLARHTRGIRAETVLEELSELAEPQVVLDAPLFEGKTLMKVDAAGLYSGKDADETVQERLALAAETGVEAHAAHLQLALLHFRHNRPAAALEAAQRACELNPHYFHNHFILGHLYLQLGKPSLAGPAFANGVQQARISCLEAELQLLHEIEKENFGSSFFTLLGNLYEENGRGLQEGILQLESGDLPLWAIHYYKLALDLDENNTRALLDLGLLFHKHGACDWAVITLRSLVEKAPLAPDARFFLGLAQMQCFQRFPGIRSLAQSFCLERTGAQLEQIEKCGLQEGEWDYFWGEVYWSEDKLQQAEQSFIKAVDRVAAAAPLLRLGEFYLEHSGYSQARRVLRKYNQLVPYSARGYYLLGMAYLRLEFPDLARWCLERSIKYEPEYPAARQALSRLTRAAGNQPVV